MTLAPTAQPIDFLEEQDFDPTLIRRIFSPFLAMKTRGLNHSAIQPSEVLAYACHSNDGTCFLSPTAQPMNFLEGQDFDPTLIRRIFSPFSAMKYRGLNHSATLPLKMWSMPAIVMTGRNISTLRPAHGLFWQQDSNLRISDVYIVRSPRKLGALTTRPILLPKQIRLTPATVASGRVFITNRPAYGLF